MTSHLTAALLLAAASIAFASPDDRATVPAGDLEVWLKAARVPADAHAHVVLDGGPALEADLAEPLKLRDLAPGPHALRAVLVSPDHVSLKGKKTLAVLRFWVGPRPSDKKVATAAERAAWPDPKKPILTLVLPRGRTTAEVTGALLDVHVKGAKLSRGGYKVRVVVDKKELPLVAEEKPLRLRLSPGAHQVTVDLLDKRATKVAPFNRTDRVFIVR